MKFKDVINAVPKEFDRQISPRNPGCQLLKDATDEVVTRLSLDYCDGDEITPQFVAALILRIARSSYSHYSWARGQRQDESVQS